MYVCGEGVSLAALSLSLSLNTHTSKTAETLFNFDQEISVKKKGGLKSMKSL